MSDFLFRFLRSTAGAAIAFAFTAIAMEALMPGSVAPYLDPIPFAIGGLLGIVIIPSPHDPAAPSRNIVSGIFGILAALIITTTVYLFAIGNGRLDMVVFVWLVVAILMLSVVLFWKRGE